MKLLRHIADKLYKYSSYYEIPKPPVIINEPKQIIRVASVVNLTGEAQEEAVRRILISEMEYQLERFVKVEKISPNFEYPNLVKYRGEIKIIEE